MPAFLETLPHRHDAPQLRDPLARFQPTPDSVLDGLRLFIDLLEHEMGKTVQLGILSPPFHRLGAPWTGLGLGRGYGKTVLAVTDASSLSSR